MAGAALFVPCMTLAIGTSSTPVVRRAGRFGDPSYGIYIYAFLVQQCVVAGSENRLGYFGALPISLFVTVLFAYLSWHLVERPCMRLKGWFGRPPLRGGKLVASGSTASSTAR
jgi:peptidoglycan/LPS O-acetylase OafA/YrhL